MVWGVLLQRLVRAGRVIACSALMVAVRPDIHNDPINQPLRQPGSAIDANSAVRFETYYDDMVVALSFSGGGTRAAAFSYGVLTALR